MKIENIAIDKIYPFPGNAKTHPAEQISKLAKEISDIGFTQPIVIDSTNVIVAGHGRYQAARQLKFEKVPCVKLSNELSEERIRAMRLFDNKIAETKWDSELLLSELEWFTSQAITLENTGFTLEEFTSLANFDDKKETDKIDTDEINEFCMFVTCETEDQLQSLFEELRERGFQVKLT